MKRISEILIVTSTEFEVEKILQKLGFEINRSKGLKSYRFENLKIDVLLSGIGIPMTIYNLTKTLSNKKHDIVINAGICGSFNPNLLNGTCVNVVQDEFADLGITNIDNSFNTLFDENFIMKSEFPFTNGKLISKRQVYDCKLQQVKGITVNSVSGIESQIQMRKDKFKPDIETMEGAAIAYVCLSEGIDFIQIRSVSNPVEPRNKDNWDISLATDNLTDAIINILESINTKL